MSDNEFEKVTGKDNQDGESDPELEEFAQKEIEKEMTRLQKGDKKEFDSDEEDIDVSYSSAGEQGEDEFDEESEDAGKENNTG